MRPHPARPFPSPRSRVHRMSLALAVLAVTLSLAAARPADGAVVINEFERASAADAVEIYNSGAAAVDLTGWVLDNGAGSIIPLAGVLPAGGYQTRTQPSFVLEGGLIELIDATLLQRDKVEFGSGGGAPQPPLTFGYSCGRSPNGVDTDDDAADWNIDPTSTFTTVNDHLGASLGGSALFNEGGGWGGPTPRGITDCFQTIVELYNPLPFPLNLAGWWLSDGRHIWELEPATIPPGGFFVANDAPFEFCVAETQVLYLFGPNGQRADQVGVAGSFLPPGNTHSYQRVPDGTGGVGPFNGFDFITSGGGSVFFVRPHTFGGTNDEVAVGVADPTIDSTWGRAKALYRED